MESRFQIEIVAAWDRIAPRWLRLQERGFGTPFQQAHWLTTWYGVFGELPEIEPVIVAVSDKRSGEDVLFIPLVRRTVGSLRTIEFADLWITDYNAPLIGPGAPSSADEAQRLWQQIQDALPVADFVRFVKMPAEIGGRRNPLALIKNTRPSLLSGYLISLPEHWEDYLASLKRNMRYLLRKRWRRFTEMGDASFRWVSEEAEARRVLDALQTMQTARFTSLGIRHVFDDPIYSRFYQRHVLDGLSKGTAILTALAVDGEIVATFLAVGDGQRCTLVRSSQLVGDKWGPLGLGKLLIERSMQALHERGYRTFDLSIGDHPYKHDFGVEPAPLLDFELARSWRGVPALYRDRTVAMIKKNPWAASFARTLKRGLTSAPSR